MKITNKLILWGGILLGASGGISAWLLLSQQDPVMGLFVIGWVVGGEILLFSLGVRRVLSPMGELVSTATQMARGECQWEKSSPLPGEFGVCARSLSEISAMIRKSGKKLSLFLTSLSSLRDEFLLFVQKTDGDVPFQGPLREKGPISLSLITQSIGEVTDSIQILSASVDAISSFLLQINAAVAEVSGGIQTFSSSVGETFSSLSQMSASTKNMAEHADILAMAAEETVSSVGEINTSIKEVEHNAGESATLAEKVSTEAQEVGVRSIEKTIGGIKRIKEAVEKSALVIQRLGGRIEHIGKFLTVIEEVTRQTTLLSLNASILAAQAGEQGKGFAVVADEIKKLADRTAASTQEIAQLVVNVQGEAREAVKSIEEGALSVEEGMKGSLEAGDVLKNILMSFKKSSEMAQGIERATVEQAKGIRQVMESMTQINSMIRQIAQTTGEQSRWCENVVQTMEKMQGVTRQVTAWTEDQAQGGKGMSDVVSQMMTQIEKVRQITGAHTEEAKKAEVALTGFYKERAERKEATSRITHALSLLEKEIRSFEQEAAWFLKNEV